MIWAEVKVGGAKSAANYSIKYERI
jgi:hypothetical protein